MGKITPYAVWAGDALITEICDISTWRAADTVLRDHVDVDWGSFAWKANKTELTRFFEQYRWDTAKLEQLDAEADYAAVFIETVWGDSA